MAIFSIAIEKTHIGWPQLNICYPSVDLITLMKFYEVRDRK